jgi:hypothetical protein
MVFVLRRGATVAEPERLDEVSAVPNVHVRAVAPAHLAPRQRLASADLREQDRDGVDDLALRESTVDLANAVVHAVKGRDDREAQLTASGIANPAA